MNRLLVLSATFLGACLASPRWSACAESQPSRSVDDELLESLNADPLDEFDRQLFAPGDKDRQPPKRPPDGAGTSGEAGDLRRQLLRELGPAGVPEELNPLLEITRQMRQVEGLIGRTESGPKTQDLQGRIVARLEELIKQARSRCQGGKPSQASPKVAPRQGTKQPRQKPGTSPAKQASKPTPDGKAKPGKTENRQADMSDWEAVRKGFWGELPQKAREQMLELPVEEFLPKYKWLIEQYFKRLAERPEAANDSARRTSRP